MKFWLGVTDTHWYNYLSKIQPEDINFWQPGGNTVFKVIKPGDLFLFKLKGSLNAIGGVGFFVRHTFLPLSIAWDTFLERNGFSTVDEFKISIQNYRRKNHNSYEEDPVIGCIVLTNPIFFSEKDWISVPQNWGHGIVQGKSYSTDDEIGKKLWEQIQNRLVRSRFYEQQDELKNQLILEEPAPMYGNSILAKVRLGQGAFRVMVTDAYSKRCAVTGERTLPVLEAAHIKPFAKSGPHFISNGLLLRSDLHKLFDIGYITVTPEYKVEVSKRIKEEYENGREYYQFQGKSLSLLPNRENDKPRKEYLEWHNNIFKG